MFTKKAGELNQFGMRGNIDKGEIQKYQIRRKRKHIPFVNINNCNRFRTEQPFHLMMWCFMNYER